MINLNDKINSSRPGLDEPKALSTPSLEGSRVPAPEPVRREPVGEHLQSAGLVVPHLPARLTLPALSYEGRSSEQPKKIARHSPTLRPLARPNGSLVTRHLPALRPPLRANGSFATVFLTGTPKQLEIAANHTKQSTEVIPNRDKNTTLQTAMNAAEMAGPDRKAQSAAADAPTTATPPGGPARHSSLATRHSVLRTLSNRNSKLLETAVTQTKHTIGVLSNRDKIAPPSEAN